jgi:hypothetical protein
MPGCLMEPAPGDGGAMGDKGLGGISESEEGPTSGLLMAGSDKGDGTWVGLGLRP